MRSPLPLTRSALAFWCPLVLATTLICSAAQAQIPHRGVQLSDEVEAYEGFSKTSIVESKFREGLDLLREGKCKKAQASLGVVLREVSNDANVQFLQGMAFRCDQEHKKAANQFRRAVRTDRSMYMAYKYLGLTYLDLEQPKKAGGILSRLDRFRDRCANECAANLESSYTELASAIEAKMVN